MSIKYAKKLLKVDDVYISNPYVCVYWNDKPLLVTDAKLKNIDPIWEGENLILRVPQRIDGSQETLFSQSLRLEVYDKAVYGPPNFLGQIQLEGESLSNFLGKSVVDDNYTVLPPCQC